MIKKLLPNLSFFLLVSVHTYHTYAAEISWDIGLTENRAVITAQGVINNTHSKTILYLDGLDGDPTSTAILEELLQEFSSKATLQDNNLIVISNANPDGDDLQFPPQGQAYSENAISHVLWRWIGSHAPDLIVLGSGNDFSFAETVSNTGIAGFGTIPVVNMSAGNSRVEFLLANADLESSPARSELERRAARAPRAFAEELAEMYGHEFSTPVYVPGMSVIGRLRLGHLDAVNALLAPYLGGLEFEVSNSSALAGQLVFAEHAIRTGNQQSMALTLRAAELAFTENGEQLEVVPMHYEMSDAFFMATPLLAKAGVLTGDNKYFDMAIRHVSFMRNMLLRDNGLYRHSPDADVAWSRGNGFPALGLALTLSDFPKDHPARDVLLGMLIHHLEALLPYQDADGMWHEVIDFPGSFAEITSTAMIGIAIKRGLDQGWLPEDRYSLALDKAWEAVKIRTSFDGVFINACTSTGKMPSLDAYLDRLAIFDKDDRAGGMVMNFALEMASL
ncbi:MAG: glycoside hydrolase family 88 protein [Gammaproteobacteria bacterium]|nr:glycoside hydrolase family 88 protein [Gammaproteobacteria bacterium]MDD9894536.1 glycoside hydrolase family 88 protein [Gammaproteobacteria bacterium]MDD9957628.1 glycoside hydrolase family 88 protein [Gammaproteobacteria bacterium]